MSDRIDENLDSDECVTITLQRASDSKIVKPKDLIRQIFVNAYARILLERKANPKYAIIDLKSFIEAVIDKTRRHIITNYDILTEDDIDAFISNERKPLDKLLKES